jgi:DNA ligase 1
MSVIQGGGQRYATCGLPAVPFRGRKIPQATTATSLNPLLLCRWATSQAMSETLADGQSVKVKGSGSSVYTLKNNGGVYSCTCPAWMHQNIGIEQRTCKHLRAYLGDAAETQRVGAGALTGKPARPAKVVADGVIPEPDADEGPPLLLAHKWENDIDLTGWWLSEKLDGVRAYWDGTQFISRLGNKFFAPRWFIEKLPPTPLDGELWGGRKLFQRTVGIVKRQDESELWRELQYMVFDAPAQPGLFEDRMAFVEATVAERALTWLAALPHARCEGTAHLLDELKRVEALGGEGLMVRKPASRYEAGRSTTLYKVKTFHDAEARVVAHVPGLGKHRGRLGALLVELPDGTQFNVGTGFSDSERESPPPPGALITFRYQELSNTGVPRFPSYVGERIDGRFRAVVAPPIVQAPVRPAAAAAVLAQAPANTNLPATDPAPATKGNRMTLRRFEMTDGDERFFWEIETVGLKQRIRFGTFEEKSKLFEDNADAIENSLQKITDKLAKGFVEVAGAPVPAASTASAATAPAAPTATPPASVAPPAATAATPAPAQVTPALVTPATPVVQPDSVPVTPVQRPGGARYFEFVEGGSAKFWEVRVEGNSFFTRYGKIGTAGQVTQKDFDSDAKSRAEADKLIAEKTKKGYVEK